MIHPSTLGFLYELKRNNNREWFAANRARYDTAKADVMALGEQIIKQVNRFDPSLGNIDPSKAMFRINRDIRFSANKEPYKSNMGLALTPGGMRRNTLSCYYIHIEPDNCLIATGVYMPLTPKLKAIRRFIDDESDEFLSIVGNSEFRATFGDLNRQGKILKRIPTGFSAESPVAEYLKLSDFHVTYPISDDLICSEQYIPTLADVLHISQPLNAFLNKAITEME